MVRAVLGGDREAYGVLVRAHSAAVFRVAFRIVGNEADAEEIVQEAFLRAYQQLEGFELRCAFATWIYRIAVNCALNRIGRSGPESGYRPGERCDAEERTVAVAEPGPDPERALLSREIGAAEEMAMRRLTAIERTAFVLRHHEERTMGEIAGILGIEPNAAKQAVFRAVRKLRRELAPLRSNA